MPLRVLVPRRFAVLVALTAALALLGSGRGLAAAPGAPDVVEPIVATVYGGAITLHGEGFGERADGSAVRFTYGSHEFTLPATSSVISTWQDGLLEMNVPPEVQSGHLVVSAAGVESDPVELLVYEYQAFDVPSTPGWALAIALADEGTVWVNEEFHLELKSLDPAAKVVASVSIPQAPGPGIFASNLFGDGPARMSVLGEDIAIDPSGRIWFTQGGGFLYQGVNRNTSRLVRYDPALQQFSCFNSPIDNSEVIGVAVDVARGLAWYSEGDLVHGNAITAVTLESKLSDCSFDPYGPEPVDPLCTVGPRDDCHWRLQLPGATRFPAHLAIDEHGDIWFTEFWANHIGRLTPETGEIVELPLPPSIAQEGPGRIVQSGPWELGFDDAGDLWVNEFFDATILRVRPSLLASQDCLHLDALGRNPCMEEIFVGSNGHDGKTIHSIIVDDGRVWFGVEENSDNAGVVEDAAIGLISTANGNAAVFLPQVDGLQSVAGMAQDPNSEDVWFAQYWDHKIGRLRLLGAGDADDDGVIDDADNCVIIANADQTDADGNRRGDACDRVIDTDSDGCVDAAELGSDPVQGGQRDPLDFWDFYDTPSDTGDRDATVDLMSDLFGVLFRFGQEDGGGTAPVNRESDPIGVPPPAPSYFPAFDRSPAPPGAMAWELGPPDGTIDLFNDIFGAAAQFGHSCAG